MSLTNRYEFVFLFDVKDGNPNGDPDAGNLPRVDAETGMGLVTDVCLKRKVRNFIDISKNAVNNYDIYVKEKAILNRQHARAYTESEELVALLQSLEEAKKIKKPRKGVDETAYKEAQKIIKDANTEDIARQWACKNYYDVRAFGAVMSTSDKSDSKIAKKAGQVRGPIQITFSRSLDPIVTSEHTLTVVAARKADKPIEQQIGIQGRKFTVPYGLYRCHGFVSAHLANQTGFSENDLELFWQSLLQMFDHDRSASRGEMSARGLYVFKHSTALGNAPAADLFRRIKVQLNDGVEVARSPDDYHLTVELLDDNEGIELLTKLNYWKAQ